MRKEYYVYIMTNKCKTVLIPVLPTIYCVVLKNIERELVVVVSQNNTM